MRRPADVTVDVGKCTGCGRCVRVCPADTLVVENGKARVVGPTSLGCGHCVAICPEGAISVGFIDTDSLTFDTITNSDIYVKPGDYDVGRLVGLMRSRRSSRDFGPEPVPMAVLNDLVRVGTTAPSGSNSQDWRFTILPDRSAVEYFSNRLGGFYEKLNKLAENPFARLWSKAFMRDSLGIYYRDYYESVKEGLRQYREEGRDRLFFKAPAVIMVSSGPDASCASEDALLATQNMILAAHAMGFGTCLIGFAVEAMKHAPDLKISIGIPKTEPVYSVIAIGQAKDQYLRPTGRKKVVPRVFRP